MLSVQSLASKDVQHVELRNMNRIYICRLIEFTQQTILACVYLYAENAKKGEMNGAQ